MMQQQLIQQEELEQEEVLQREERTETDLSVTASDMMGNTLVELSRDVMTAVKERIRTREGTEQRVSIEEDTETETITVMSEALAYAGYTAGIQNAWEQLAALETDQAVTVSPYVLLQALEATFTPAVTMDTISLPDGQPGEPSTTAETPAVQDTDWVDDIDTTPLRTRQDTGTEIQYRDENAGYTVETKSVNTLDTDLVTPIYDTPERSVIETKDCLVGTSSGDYDALLTLVRAEDGLTGVQRRGTAVVARYDEAVHERGTSQRVLYELDETVLEPGEEMTVKDSLLELVDRGEIDATIVRQPFYSTESFEDAAGHDYAEGWQDGFEGLIQLEGERTDLTEFSTGSREDLELAMNGIDQETVSYGETVDFRSSEEYACGAAEDISEHREAWQDRFGVWLDDAADRSVYAALAEGYAFEGSALNLANFTAARDAYQDSFGSAPERIHNNVVYDPLDDALDTPAYAPA